MNVGNKNDFYKQQSKAVESQGSENRLCQSRLHIRASENHKGYCSPSQRITEIYKDDPYEGDPFESDPFVFVDPIECDPYEGDLYESDQ